MYCNVVAIATPFTFRIHTVIIQCSYHEMQPVYSCKEVVDIHLLVHRVIHTTLLQLHTHLLTPRNSSCIVITQSSCNFMNTCMKIFSHFQKVHLKIFFTLPVKSLHTFAKRLINTNIMKYILLQFIQ